MQAYCYVQYGGPEVLKLQQVAKPTLQGDSEIVIKIICCAVTSGDKRLRAAEVPYGFHYMFRLAFGWSGPRTQILGMNFSGQVESVGSRVTRFKVGDRVVGFSSKNGCYAEYVKMGENDVLAHLPDAVSFEDGAAIPFGGCTALAFLKKANVQKGEKIAVNGASGAVGCAVVQLAKHYFEAGQVVGVCSAKNAEFVRSLGADRVFDYGTQSYLQEDKDYDVIVDTVGNQGCAEKLGSLKSGGRLLLILATFPDTLRGIWYSMVGQHKVIAGPTFPQTSDLELLVDLVATNRFRSNVEKVFPFEQMVEAHRYPGGRGNVVVVKMI